MGIVEDMEDFGMGDYLGGKGCLIEGLCDEDGGVKWWVGGEKGEERRKVIWGVNRLWIEEGCLWFWIK